LAHLFLEHTAQIDRLYDDSDENASTIQEEEEQANQLSRNWLVDQEKLAEFIQETQPFFSRAKIEAFARTRRRHPGIILGQLQQQGYVNYKNLRSLLVKVSP
jgi:HTH-type transcriptional regulator/antitoxin HigA